MNAGETCVFKESHDEKTLEPLGAICGKPATQEIRWRDGRWSPACPEHGLRALDRDARRLVAAVVKLEKP